MKGKCVLLIDFPFFIYLIIFISIYSINFYHYLQSHLFCEILLFHFSTIVLKIITILFMPHPNCVPFIFQFSAPHSVLNKGAYSDKQGSIRCQTKEHTVPNK